MQLKDIRELVAADLAAVDEDLGGSVLRLARAREAVDRLVHRGDDKRDKAHETIVRFDSAIDVVPPIRALTHFGVLIQHMGPACRIRQIDPFGTEADRLCRSGQMLPTETEADVVLRIELILCLD